MNIVIMLLVPPTLFFTANKNIWLKGVLLAVLLICGIIVSLKASYLMVNDKQLVGKRFK